MNHARGTNGSGPAGGGGEGPESDGQDGGCMGKANTEDVEDGSQPVEAVKGRPTAAMPVGGLSDTYRMDHPRRGLALLLVHSQYQDNYVGARPTADHDRAVVREAFEALRFKVEEHWDLKKYKIKDLLKEVASRDHSECDALAVVFMSHGGVKNNKEFLCASDDTFNTLELWVNFTPKRCPSLAGKPKLYFIQACRGDNVDRGVKMQVGLRVQTDGSDSMKDPQVEYVLPIHADQLVMWASYPGLPAFRSLRNGIKGSVFLHFLAKVLKEGSKMSPCPSLASLVLRVTREVAVCYESSHDKFSLDHNKQTPYTHSTLLRDVFFFGENN